MANRPAPVTPDVLVERRGPAQLLTLNRPARHNAVGGTLFADVLRAAERADADHDVRAMVTTGAGRMFCVGADLDELSDVLAAGPIDLGVLGLDSTRRRQGPSGPHG